MGSRGDIVLSPRSYARNYLLPSQKAYYVPRSLGKPVLPDNWILPEQTSNLQLETIKPAIIHVEYTDSLELSHQKQEMSVQELKEKLADVKLGFERVLIHEEADKIFGSVTAGDIQEQLFEKYGLMVDKEAIHCRLKSVGKHMISIMVQQESIDIPVEIKSQ
jgi:ribosomal protein L9